MFFEFDCNLPPLFKSFSLDQPKKLEKFSKWPLTKKPSASLSLPLPFNLVLNSIKFKENLTSIKEMVSLPYNIKFMKLSKKSSSEHYKPCCHNKTCILIRQRLNLLWPSNFSTSNFALAIQQNKELRLWNYLLYTAKFRIFKEAK